MAERLSVGVVGVRRGGSLLNCLVNFPDVEVTAVCDRNEVRLREAASRHNVRQSYGDFSQMLDCELDAVIVATPPPTHAELCIQALESGRHVLCEVPAIHRLEEADRLRKAVAGSGKVYMFAENCNYWSHVELAARIIRDGLIGPVFYMEAEYLHDCRELFFDSDGARTWRWRSPLNCMYCTHSLGPLLYATGHRVRRVGAISSGPCRTIPGLPKSDTEVAIMQTDQEALLRLRVDFVSPRPEHGHHFLWHGPKGIVDIPFGWMDEGRVYLAQESEKGWQPLSGFKQRYPMPERENLPDWATSGGHGTAEFFMLRDFVKSCRQGKPVRLDVEEGLAITLPGLLALESVRTGDFVDMP